MTSPLHLDFPIQYYTARPVCSAQRIRHQLIFMRTRPSPSFLHQRVTHISAFKFLSHVLRHSVDVMIFLNNVFAMNIVFKKAH
jgi:hypothetical protein